MMVLFSSVGPLIALGVTMFSGSIFVSSALRG